MNWRKREEIYARTTGKHYLRLMETSVLKIPEAIEAYDPDMFVCFNALKQKYEIHSLKNKGDTHCLTIPWPELDERALQLNAERDLNRRSLKEIIKEIDDHNAALEAARDRQRHNDLYAIAGETRPIFKRFAEERGI